MPKRRRSLGWRQRLVISAGAVFTVLLLLLATVVGYTYWRYNQIHRIDLGLHSAAAGAPQNYLIVGSDSRSAVAKNDPNAGAFLGAGAPGADSARSDTIMVLRVDPKKTQAQLLSLPRDLWVNIPGENGHDRINAAFGRGPKVLTATIESNFGITINHYVEVNFAGFKQIVDAMGGIPLYFDTPMYDNNSGLNVTKAGCVTMNGTQALAFARARHLHYIENGVDTLDGTSDLGRISRQQLLIRKAIPRAESKGLTDPIALNDLIGSTVHNVTLDKGLGAGTLLDLASRFRHFDSQHLLSYSVPTTRYFTPGGADVLILDTAKATKTLALFRDGTTSAESGVNVQVLNGSGVAKQAANVGGALSRVGFHVVGTGDSSQLGLGQVTNTQIRYASGDKAAALLLARHLSVDADVTPIAGMQAGTVVLVTGTNFTTVRTKPRTLPASVVGTTPTTTKSSSTGVTTTTVEGRVPGQAPPGVNC